MKAASAKFVALLVGATAGYERRVWVCSTLCKALAASRNLVM